MRDRDSLRIDMGEGITAEGGGRIALEGKARQGRATEEGIVADMLDTGRDNNAPQAGAAGKGTFPGRRRPACTSAGGVEVRLPNAAPRRRQRFPIRTPPREIPTECVAEQKKKTCSSRAQLALSQNGQGAQHLHVHIPPYHPADRRRKRSTELSRVT